MKITKERIIQIKGNCNFYALGYSLIELMVVISIMAILFSVGMANYRDYSRKREVSNAALLVRGDLRLTQEFALAGRKPAEPAGNVCLAANSLLEYYIFERIPTSNASGLGYKISAKCSSSNSPVEIKSVDLSLKNITISTFTNTVNSNRNRIHFYPRGKGVGNLTADSTTITLTKVGASPVEITVTVGGEVK